MNFNHNVHGREDNEIIISYNPVMNTENLDGESKQRIALSKEGLPPLKKDFVRIVHITTPYNAGQILTAGLDYEKYGMAMSTARAYGNPEKVEYGSDDPRFNYPGLKVVVMDMSNDDWKLHNNVSKCPGRIPPEQIVGIVDIDIH